MANTKKKVSLKLIELYQQSQEDKDQQGLSLVVEQGQLQLKADLLATQQALLVARSNYEKALTVIPFSPSLIIEAKKSINSLEEGIVELEKLEELF